MYISKFCWLNGYFHSHKSKKNHYLYACIKDPRSKDITVSFLLLYLALSL